MQQKIDLKINQFIIEVNKVFSSKTFYDLMSIQWDKYTTSKKRSTSKIFILLYKSKENILR